MFWSDLVDLLRATILSIAQIVVAALTGIAVSIGATPETARSVQVFSALLIGGITIWFLSSTSALFAFSAGAGSLVGILQGWILRREMGRGAPSPA